MKKAQYKQLRTAQNNWQLFTLTNILRIIKTVVPSIRKHAKTSALVLVLKYINITDKRNSTYSAFHIARGIGISCKYAPSVGTDSNFHILNYSIQESNTVQNINYDDNNNNKVLTRLRIHE